MVEGKFDAPAHSRLHGIALGKRELEREERAVKKEQAIKDSVNKPEAI